MNPGDLGLDDALFSPMSAMRGVEYQLVPGKDVIVPRPFRHNPERMGRLAAFCDMWTSYQLGLTSYESLNSQGPGMMDEFCRLKPGETVEIVTDISEPDLQVAMAKGERVLLLGAGPFT